MTPHRSHPSSLPVEPRGTVRPRVAIVHDYLTQRGGAERVALAMLEAFPGAPLYTSLYSPETTFPEFSGADVRPSVLNRMEALRRHHRAALPFLATTFSRLNADADVTVCSSSGWAHAARTGGRKLVYCHTPAHWLYDADRYVGASHVARAGSMVFGPPLRRWDQRAAASADRYVANSSAVRDRIRALYDRDAEVLPPPPTLDPLGPQRALPGVEPGFVLCVSRLLPYKNVDAVIEAFRALPDVRLVVVGDGPEAHALQRQAPANVHLVGRIDDASLRWAYASCRGLVAASFEDFGIAPLEAASFGRPTAALAAGGYLDTMVDGLTGTSFAAPQPSQIAASVRLLLAEAFDDGELRKHAATFGVERFTARLRAIVDELANTARVDTRT